MAEARHPPGSAWLDPPMRTGHAAVTSRPTTASLLRRRIDVARSPCDVLRALRGAPGLFGLVGEWGGRRGAIVGHDALYEIDRPDALLGALDDLPEVTGWSAPGGFDATAKGREPGAVGGGWFGYLGYQLGRLVEPVPAPGTEPASGFGRLGYYESLLVYHDHGRTWWFEALVSEGAEERIEARFAADVQALEQGGSSRPYAVSEHRFEPSLSDHAQAIARVREYIRAGDVFQVNACLHAVADFDGHALDLFCGAVETLTPRFGAFLSLHGGGICSFSPELFLRAVQGRVTSSPIKGTVARARGPDGSERQRRALETSAKDRAENAMIVDLVRNDLSRVCAPGSVEVGDVARAEPHPGVWHLVSDVHGTLAPGVGYGDLVRATFPPGSITGAPKLRAMEIINELEPLGRGVYTGAIGYSSPLGGLCLNVAIRTFEVVDRVIRLGVGGGIVADSDVSAEVEECLVKARPLLAAAAGRSTQIAEGARGKRRARPDASSWDAVLLRPRPAMGVFETMRAVDGHVPWLDRHLRRLEASVREVFGRRLPEGVPTMVEGTISSRQGGNRVRVEVRPAGGELRVTVTCEPFESAPAAERHRAPSADVPARAPVSLWATPCPGGLGRHKWSDRRLVGALREERSQAVALGPGDQLLLVDAGSVLEGDRGNVFAVVDGVLRTPGRDAPILGGVARGFVLEAARRLGIPLSEGALAVQELIGADEVFVTNALRGVERVGVLADLGDLGPLRARRRPSNAVADELAHAVHADWASARPRRARRAGPKPRSRTSLRRSVPGISPPTSGTPAASADRGPVVVIDNFDSFTYNVSAALGVLGECCTILRSSDVDVEALRRLRPAAIVISPGPCSPREAPASMRVVRELGATVPMLGICLGHQCIAAAYGALSLIHI